MLKHSFVLALACAGCKYIIIEGVDPSSTSGTSEGAESTGTSSMSATGGGEPTTTETGETTSGTTSGTTDPAGTTGPTAGTTDAGETSSSGSTGERTTGDESSSTGFNPDCGGRFSTDWCPQVGLNEQFTRCGEVLDDGRTCVEPEIRYGTLAGGVPQQHNGNELDTWCAQLGFAASDGVEYGTRSCPPGGGLLHGSGGFDEVTWHWVDSGVGFWHDKESFSFPCLPDDPNLMAKASCK